MTASPGTVRETVRTLTEIETSAKAREYCNNAGVAVSRILRRINLDGEISLTEAAAILKEKCPHLSDSDARKLVRITFNQYAAPLSN